MNKQTQNQLGLNGLTAISPVDGRYGSKTQALRTVFSEFGLIKYRVEVEIRWFQYLAQTQEITELPSLDSNSIKFLDSIINEFAEQDAVQVKAYEKKTNHDVKAVEYYVKYRFNERETLKPHKEFIHFACTSEDINNLAYALMLKQAKTSHLLPAITELTTQLTALAHSLSDQAMLSRTHGQPATPTTMGKEIANVVYRLRRQLDQLEKTMILGKINGAVGNYNAHQVCYPAINWPALAKGFVEQLGLDWNAYTIQIEPHDYLAEFFDNLSRLNNILIDTSRDIWSYISLGYFNQKKVEGETGSSTMPHKVNPIDFENAEGNFGIANALLRHFSQTLPLSRWQRDLSDSTLLRNIGVAIAHSMIGYQSFVRGIAKLEINPERLKHDLDSAWELLAEPIQMVMRKYHIDNPYEKLKELTRGQQIDKATLKQFIESLDIPDDAKQKLFELTPANYLGNASQQARQI